MAQPSRKPEPMSDTELVRILTAEEADSSSYYASELAQVQAVSMDAFLGKITNDELLPNRSSVVTQDVRDTINWMMPHLRRTFAPGAELISIDDDMRDDNDPALADAKDYLGYVVFKDNRGTHLVHDFIFDGLVQRIGIGRAWWEDAEEKPVQRLKGVTPEQLIRYVNDPDYEIVAQEMHLPGAEYEDDDGPAHDAHEAQETEYEEAVEDASEEATALVPVPPEKLGEITFTLDVKFRPKCGRVRMAVVPPEEFRVNRRARSLDEADYHGWKHEVFLQDVLTEFPEKAMELDPDFATSGTKNDQSLIDADMRVLARFPDELNTGQHFSRTDDSRRKLWQMIEYIRVDADGDGIVELRRVRRIGDVILENDRVEESEFTAWTPVRVSHRLIGLSEADLVMDIQKIRTALMRRAMDGLTRTLAPRTFYDKQAAGDDPDFVDRLLDHDVGDAIGVNGNPNDKILIQQTPDVSTIAFNAIEYMDRRSEEASGVNRHAMGIQPQAITDTAKGIENLQTAANSRIEEIARWIGDGLEIWWGKALRLLIAHQDALRLVKINGRKLNVDPRTWTDEMTVSVHVGMAAESREKRLVYLNMILQDQVAVVEKMGFQQPLVTIEHIAATLREKAQAMGYKDVNRFFGEIPKGWQPPQQDDPRTAEIQGKQKLAQAEMQQKAQIEGQKMQAQLQLQQAELQGKQKLAVHDMQVQQAVAAAKADTERQAAMIKAETERQIAQMRIESEARISAERLAAEMDLARWKAELEVQHRAALSDSTNLPGNRPGGRLDA